MRKLKVFIRKSHNGWFLYYSVMQVSALEATEKCESEQVKYLKRSKLSFAVN